MKCFWLKGSAFLGAVPGSASGAQTGLRPHCSSCFLVSPRMPSAWARLCPLPMVPAGLSPWNDSSQRTVSVAGPWSMASPSVSPGSAARAGTQLPFAQTTVLLGSALCVPSCAGHCGETGGSAGPQTFNHKFHFLLLVVESS